MSTLQTCGHRLAATHFSKIRRKAREWNVKEAEALRRIIEKYEGD